MFIEKLEQKNLSEEKSMEKILATITSTVWEHREFFYFILYTFQYFSSLL